MVRLDEFALIRKLTGRKQSKAFQHRQGVSVGIGDDAAVAGISPHSQLVMSCDTVVEGIHFNRWTMEDEDIGFKAMASNVSDIAAMGAVPKYALISISLPKKFPEYRLKRIYSGIYECAGTYQVAVVGGDTTSSPRDFTLSITIIGEVESNKALLRSAAEPGDIVFITGLLGRSAAGLDYLTKLKQSRLSIDAVPESLKKIVLAHRKPEPSTKAGRLLLHFDRCHALNDISDGLASEMQEIAEASKVGIVLYEESIPVPPDVAAYAMNTGGNPLEWILYGGEDYVLVGTVPAQYVSRLQQAFQDAELEFYNIGEVTHKSEGIVKLFDRAGNLKLLKKEGYHHF